MLPILPEGLRFYSAGQSLLLQAILLPVSYCSLSVLLPVFERARHLVMFLHCMLLSSVAPPPLCGVVLVSQRHIYYDSPQIDRVSVCRCSQSTGRIDRSIRKIYQTVHIQCSMFSMVIKSTLSDWPIENPRWRPFSKMATNK